MIIVMVTTYVNTGIISLQPQCEGCLRGGEKTGRGEGSNRRESGSIVSTGSGTSDWLVPQPISSGPTNQETQA